MDAHEASANREPETNSPVKAKNIKSSQESDNVLSKIYGKLHQSKFNIKRYRQGKIRKNSFKCVYWKI